VPTSPARAAAFKILLAVDRGSAHADDLLRDPQVDSLSQPDRNLTTTLVLGVLRWQLNLDAAFRPFLARPNAKLDPEILIALRMGAFQLLYLDRIPAHAAIGESVELARQAGHRFASRMVNAVLRKLSVAPINHNAAQDAEQAHPAWLVERWKKNYGYETAQAICLHNQQPPPSALRLNEISIERELIEAGIGIGPGRLLTNARSLISGDITTTDAFLRGRLRIQDEGSQLIAEVAACASSVQKIQTILDACAAPGGKTIILADRNPLAGIVACESSPQRMAAMKNRLAAFGNRIEFRLADAASLNEPPSFDLALVDAPCSGTGTLGRNPEIRHRLHPDGLARHAERQQAILRAATRAIRPAGRIVYSTCSLEPEENEQVVQATLNQFPDLRQIPLAQPIEALLKSEIVTADGAQNLQQCLTPDGALRLIPGSLGTDGFYVALIEKLP